jgi:hypothetical protein
MECSCVYVEADSYWDFANFRMLIARKIHKCHECGREIAPGEKYENLSGMCEGDFLTHKTCADCLSIRDAFYCHGWQFETVLENLRDYIHDSQGDVKEDCLRRLTPKAREIVCGMIEDAWMYWYTESEG